MNSPPRTPFATYTCRDPRCGFCHLVRGRVSPLPYRLFTFGVPPEGDAAFSEVVPLINATKERAAQAITDRTIGTAPAGLPLPSTAPLTSAERAALKPIAAGYRIVAEQIEAAIATHEGKGRVDLARYALGFAERMGDRAAAALALIGRGR